MRRKIRSPSNSSLMASQQWWATAMGLARFWLLSKLPLLCCYSLQLSKQYEHSVDSFPSTQMINTHASRSQAFQCISPIRCCDPVSRNVLNELPTVCALAPVKLRAYLGANITAIASQLSCSDGSSSKSIYVSLDIQMDRIKTKRQTVMSHHTFGCIIATSMTKSLQWHREEKHRRIWNVIGLTKCQSLNPTWRPGLPCGVFPAFCPITNQHEKTVLHCRP